MKLTYYIGLAVLPLNLNGCRSPTSSHSEKTLEIHRGSDLILPNIYRDSDHFFPVEFLESVKIKKEHGDPDFVKKICKLAIDVDEVNQKRFGQSYLIKKDCDIVRIIIELDSDLIRHEVDGRIPSNELANSAREILNRR